MNNRIEIDKIEFKNILSYGNKWQSFELKSGISFITGKQLYSDRRNFTGKSNLLKIFPYGLFGKIEGKNKSRIINWKNKKNCEVYTYFKKGNTSYCIHRGIKPDILELYENGKQAPTPSNKVDFQKQIEDEILEMDYDSFMHTVYADTNSSQSIFTLSKPNKRQFLDNMFSLSYYVKLKDAALKKINQTDKEIQDTESNIQYKKKSQSDLQSQIYDFERDLENVSDNTESKNKCEKYLTDNKEKFEATKERIEELENKKRGLEEEKNQIEKILIKISNKIKEIKKHKVNVKVEDININSINSQINTLQDEMESLNSMVPVNIKPYADNYLESLKSEVVKLETNINHAEKQYKEIESKLNNKIDTVECPACFQEVDHHLIETHFKREIESISVDHKQMQEKYYMKLTELNTIKEEKEKEVEKERLESEIRDKQNKIDKLQETKAKWEENEKIKKDIEKSKRVVKKLEEAQNKYNNVITNSGINEIETKINDNNYVIETYEKARDEFEKFKDKINQEEQERKRIRGYIKSNRNKINSFGKEIKDHEKSLNTLKRKKDYWKILKDLCADEEAKQYTISNKIPILNRYVNDYLSQAGVDFYVKLDNWLEVDIKGSGRKGCTYHDLSGAERVSLDRATQFSFSDMNKLQNPVFMDLMILDEILDSSVDNEGLKNIINIVQAKQKNDKSKILIVSHREGFESLEEFIDNYYEIMYDGSYSKIEVK